MTDPTPLELMEARIAQFVNDVGYINYSTDQIDEGIQQALDWLNVNLGTDYVVSSGSELDSGTALPDNLGSTVVQGASGFMLLGQAAQLVIAANIQPGAPGNMVGWVKMQMDAFIKAVDKLKLQAMQNSPDVPYSAMDWEEDDSDAGVD